MVCSSTAEDSCTTPVKTSRSHKASGQYECDLPSATKVIQQLVATSPALFLFFAKILTATIQVLVNWFIGSHPHFQFVTIPTQSEQRWPPDLLSAPLPDVSHLYGTCWRVVVILWLKVFLSCVESSRPDPVRSGTRSAAAPATRALSERRNIVASMTGLVFVTTDGSAKVPRSQRGIIRSHCMREKNKQPQSRRSRREARRLLAAAKESESEKASDVSSITSATSDTASQTQLPAAQAVHIEHVKLPVAPPPDWALIRFPLEMDRTSQMHFHRCRSPYQKVQRCLAVRR